MTELVEQKKKGKCPKKIENLPCRLHVLGKAPRHSKMFGDARLYSRRLEKGQTKLVGALEQSGNLALTRESSLVVRDAHRR